MIDRLESVCKTNAVIIVGVFTVSEFSEIKSNVTFTKIPPFSQNQIKSFLGVQNDLATRLEYLTDGLANISETVSNMF